MKVLTKGDKLVFLLILLFAVIIYLIFTFTVFSQRPDSVEVSVDGKPYASYNLTDIKDKKIVKVETIYGYNVLEITSDGVLVTDASCPDKTDVQSGKITKSNQMIICIPNRLSVKLTGGDLDVDKVTY